MHVYHVCYIYIIYIGTSICGGLSPSGPIDGDDDRDDDDDDFINGERMSSCVIYVSTRLCVCVRARARKAVRCTAAAVVVA